MSTSTSTSTTTISPSTYPKTLLSLNSPDGDVTREISSAPPRPCTEGEIPCIDLTGLYDENNDDIERIAKEIKIAAETSGVFYIKNHGVPEQVIETARVKALEFFRQPQAEKWKVERSNFAHHNGWTAPGNARANATETVDVKEQFRWHYSPSHDPVYDALPHPIPLESLPSEVAPYIWADERIWKSDATAKVPGFNKAAEEYWRSTLILARKLTKAIALALGFEKDGFDHLITYPCGDMALNFYPGVKPSSSVEPQRLPAESENGMQQNGLGSHTDLQCFTILYQDHIGGLLVLNPSGEWVEAPPVEGTLVVNIGDFLSRLTNDLWESTVHRVRVNETAEDRISMPLFFGFNFNEQCAVLPSCTDENNPPKYAPLSCGEWTEMKLKRSYAKDK